MQHSSYIGLAFGHFPLVLLNYGHGPNRHRGLHHQPIFDLNSGLWCPVVSLQNRARSPVSPNPWSTHTRPWGLRGAVKYWWPGVPQRGEPKRCRKATSTAGTTRDRRRDRVHFEHVTMPLIAKWSPMRRWQNSIRLPLPHSRPLIMKITMMKKIVTFSSF